MQKWRIKVKNTKKQYKNLLEENQNSTKTLMKIVDYENYFRKIGLLNF